MAKEQANQDLSLSAFVKLKRAMNTLERRLGMRAPNPAGLSLSKFAVMEALLHKGPLTHSEVAEKILTTTGNITQVVDQLARDQLVLRERCDSDRRRVYLKLTEKGTQVASRAFAEMASAIHDEMSVLSAAELRNLALLSKKLGTSLRCRLPEGE
ncbi:MAG: MarR family winged helix-turn-helix transcriptional regulator [Spirochaetales bacterium]